MSDPKIKSWNVLPYMTMFGVFFWQSASASHPPSPTVYPRPSTLETAASAARAKERIRLFQNATPKSDFPPKGSMIIPGITAGRSTMVDVESRHGPTPSIITGDAGATEATKCYEGKDQTILAFTSGAVSPGVGGFELYRSKEEAGRSSCRPLETLSLKVATENGIRLGLSSKEVHDRLGAPAKKSGGAEVYLWTTKNPQNEDCETTSYLLIWLKKGKVVSLQAGSHESC